MANWLNNDLGDSKFLLPDRTAIISPLGGVGFELVPVLKDAFAVAQIEGMIGASASRKDKLRDLAVVALISERTFRTRLRGMDVTARR